MSMKGMFFLLAALGPLVAQAASSAPSILKTDFGSHAYQAVSSTPSAIKTDFDSHAYLEQENQAKTSSPHLCMSAPLTSCFWPNIENYFTQMPGDLWGVAKYPFMERNYVPVAWGLAGSIGAIAVDKPFTKALDGAQETTTSVGLTEEDFDPKFWYVPGFMAYDTVFTYLLPVMYGYAMLAENPKLYHASLLSIKVWSYTLIYTIPIRVAFARDYPEWGPYGEILNGNFSSFWGGNDQASDYWGLRLKSFTSFRSSMWFGVADVFAAEYDNYWIPYGLAAGFTVLGRESHWFSDLVVGALVGVGISRAVQYRYSSDQNSKGQASKWQWRPIIRPNFAGLQLGWKE